MACQKFIYLNLHIKNLNKSKANFPQNSVNNFNANNMPKPYIL